MMFHPRFHLVYGWVIIPCVAKLQFFILSAVDACFHFLAISMNAYLPHPNSSSLNSQVEWGNHMSVLVLSFWGSCLLLHWMLVIIYTPFNSGRVFSVLHVLASIYFVFLTVTSGGGVMTCIGWPAPLSGAGERRRGVLSPMRGPSLFVKAWICF